MCLPTALAAHPSTLEAQLRLNWGKPLNHRNVEIFDLQPWWFWKSILLNGFPPSGLCLPIGELEKHLTSSTRPIGRSQSSSRQPLCRRLHQSSMRIWFPSPQLFCHGAFSALSVDLVELERCIERSEVHHSAAAQCFRLGWWNDPPLNEIHQPIVPIVFSGDGSRARFSSGIVEFCRFHSCSREVGDLIAKAALPNSPSQVRAMTQHNLGFDLWSKSIAYNPIFKLYLGHRLGFNH